MRFSSHALRATAATVGVLALLAWTSSTAAAASWNITAEDDVANFWFEVDGLTGRNPIVNLTPGEAVSIVFRNAGTQPHNLHVGAPVENSTQLLLPNETANLTFTVPLTASGVGAYWCDPHRAVGMEGAVNFTAAMAGNQTGGNTTGTGTPPARTPGFDGMAAAMALAVAVGFAARQRRS